MERIPASERTREKLRALMAGRSEVGDERSELVRLAARLIIEEALEAKREMRWGAQLLCPRSTPWRRVSQRLSTGSGGKRGGRHRVQRTADRRSG